MSPGEGSATQFGLKLSLHTHTHLPLSLFYCHLLLPPPAALHVCAINWQTIYARVELVLLLFIYLWHSLHSYKSSSSHVAVTAQSTAAATSTAMIAAAVNDKHVALRCRCCRYPWRECRVTILKGSCGTIFKSRSKKCWENWNWNYLNFIKKVVDLLNNFCGAIYVDSVYDSISKSIVQKIEIVLINTLYVTLYHSSLEHMRTPWSLFESQLDAQPK